MGLQRFDLCEVWFDLSRENATGDHNLGLINPEVRFKRGSIYPMIFNTCKEGFVLGHKKSFDLSRDSIYPRFDLSDVDCTQSFVYRTSSECVKIYSHLGFYHSPNWLATLDFHSPSEIFTRQWLVGERISGSLLGVLSCLYLQLKSTTKPYASSVFSPVMEYS